MDQFPEKHKALVIDDSAFQRHMLSIVCTEAGYLTVLVNNGIEALAALDEMTFSLIITDLEMPEMDGLQLIREMADQNITSKIVLVSGHSESLLFAAKQLGEQFGLNIVGTLAKPYVPEDFLELLLEASLINPSNTLNPQFQGEFQGQLSHKSVARGLEGGAVVPFYQPKVCSKKETLIGFECLARWKTDRGKILGPGSFIPTTEDYNLMTELTDVIIQQACEDVAHWHKKGFHLPVSVNISTDNLQDADFPDRVADFAERRGILPTSITLEIREPKVMEQARECLEGMSRLRLKGFGLSIDNFGTGHASLKQLQYLPLTELKIDRSYIAAAMYHKPSRTVLETGIQLAQNLSLNCVAEGIETPDQAELLSSLGCAQHQGFLYGRPMPREEVLPWMLDHFHNTENGGGALKSFSFKNITPLPSKRRTKRYH
ncbi:MAG: EAL domain-containing response regulator [Kordiimonadaceae bacterium]|nr:EAL domain-containing response regulator [Kordiimonadaceae bacterium]